MGFDDGLRTALVIRVRFRFLWPALALVLGSAAGPSVAQEASDEATYSSANFTITWTVDGRGSPDPTDADEDGVPDAIEQLVTAFEDARSFVLGLGYREPPRDELYPLYLAAGSERGSTQELPGGTGRSKPSFIVIPADLAAAPASSERMKVFAVHEYHHAVQIGYDSDEAFWIREATSSWIEDVYLDELDPNHHYLRFLLPEPERPLIAADGAHEYGAFLFLQFIVERYAAGDPAIVRELWELMAVPEAIPSAPDMSPLQAVETVLERRAVFIADAWGEFLLWQRRLAHFEEGEAYRRALQGTDWTPLHHVSTVRKASCAVEVEEGEAAPFSGHYGRFIPHRRSRSSGALLTVVGPPESGGYAAVKPADAPVIEQKLVFDAIGVARLQLPFFPAGVRQVTVGVGHVAEEDARLAYSLRVEGTNTTVAALAGSTSTTHFTPAVISGSVHCSQRPAAHAQVRITATEAGSREVTTTLATTDEDGRLRISVQPPATTTYRVEVIDPLLAPAVSSDHVLSVRVLTTLDVPGGAVEGLTATVAGTVSPPHPGAAVSILLRRPEGEWQRGPETTVGEGGSYSVQVAFPRDGVWQLRAVTSPGDDDHVAGASSVKVVRVLGSP